MPRGKIMLKKILFALVALTLALACLCACNDTTTTKLPDEKKLYTVSFKFNNGDADYALSVESGSLVPAPLTPARENYIFNGWKFEGKIWNFSEDRVYENIAFTAQWIDASSIFSYSVNDDATITVTAYNGSLTEIRIPEVISGLTVTAIADNVFKSFNDTDVTLITRPKTVKSVGKSAFEGCGFMPITILGELSHIGEQAFDGCTLLTKISLDENITDIPFRAFADCTSLTELTIPKNVSVISEDAFSGCSGIKTALLLSTDFSVDDSAFAGCDSLVTVFYMGSEADWNDVLSKVNDGGNGNDNLKNAKVYFYSELEAEGDYWHFNDKNQPRCW